MGNSNTNINEDILVEEILPALKLGLLPINAISMEAVVDRNLYYGDTAIVDVVSAAAAAGTYATTFATGDSAATGVSVTIGAPAFASWHINPHLEGQPTVARFLAHGREKAYALAKKVVQDVLALYTAKNLGDTASDVLIVSTPNYDSDVFADARGLLLNKGVGGPVTAIHNIAYATRLMKDSDIKNADKAGSNQLLSTGELPPILGIRSMYTDVFPAAITAENTGVIFTARDAVAVAIGASGVDPSGMEAQSGVQTIVVTDPDTGIRFNWRTWVDANTGIHWGSVYLSYGVSFLRAAAVRVKSA
jgi:hypothetical protein